MNATLLKVLVHHPDVELIWVCGEEDDASVRLDTMIPSLMGETSLVCTDEPTFDDVDVVFVALESPIPLGQVVEESKGRFKVIALHDPLIENTPEVEGLLYGVPELNRRYIVHDCEGVVCPNPAAYLATLALIPLAKNLMLNSEINISMVQGNKVIMRGLSDDVCIDTQSSPAIVNELKHTLQGVQTSFNKGINIVHFVNDASDTTSAVITVDSNTDIDVIESLYNDYYDDHNFVFITDEIIPCQDFVNSSKCLLYMERVEGKLIITATFNNLIKGIVGVAVHNMNLLFGLHERVGLLAF